MWKAAIDFADLQDNQRIYRAGEAFPRPGLTITAERFAELSGNGNKAKRPLIEKVGENETELEQTAVKDESATEKPKRRQRKAK